MALRGGEMLLVILLTFFSLGGAKAQLEVGFYSKSCPKAEKFVLQEMMKAVKNNTDNAAGVLRLHFHDCFVRGCDASILLDPTTTNNPLTEKVSNASSSLHGYEIIDTIKQRLEAECEGKVSCSDILAFAARDGVALTRGIHWAVPAGRRDGTISRLSETAVLPVPFMNLTQLIANFARQGLDVDDLVTLIGAHTIGIAHCGTIASRLYNFSATAKTDPAIDPSYAEHLKTVCPPGNASFNFELPMDPITPAVHDNNYYKNVLMSRGLFASDQSLMSSPGTAAMVRTFAADNQLFEKKFAAAMVKMGNIQVLTGENGEVRQSCRKIN